MQRLKKLVVGIFPLIIVLFIGLELCSARSITSSGEIQITSYVGADCEPAIYEDTVVWITRRSNTDDVSGLNLSTGKSFSDTAGPSTKGNPRIYKDIVVWEDDRNGNWDIYGYNLTTYRGFQITTNEEDQQHPAIYGDVVVWEDRRNSDLDIYGYNLKTHEEFPISASEGTQFSPEILGDLVAWHDYRYSDSAIYGYNLSTGQEFRIVSADMSLDLVLLRDFVIWQEYAWGKRTIYAFNLSSSEKFVIFRNFMQWGRTCRPDPLKLRKIAGYGDTVLWTEYRACNFDIYKFDLATKNEFQVTTDDHDQLDPALYKDTAVWIDNRNGNYDIYEYNLTLPLAPVWLTYSRKSALLKISFVGFLALVGIVASIIERKMKPLQKLAENPGRELRRGHLSIVIPAVGAVMVVALSLYFFEDLMSCFSNLFIFTEIFYIAFLFGSLVYFIDWCVRKPYIMMTDTGMTVLGMSGSVQKVNWEDIREINIQKRKIDIFLEEQEITIWLFFLPKEEREQLMRRAKDFSGSTDINLHEEP
jgi:TolB protein